MVLKYGRLRFIISIIFIYIYKEPILNYKFLVPNGILR